MTGLRSQMRYLTPYEVHKMLINEYVLRQPGDTALLKRDTSRDRTDYHVIRDNHRFLWNQDDPAMSWEEQFARKYYDKLFKEYCIGDLSLYKQNKVVALRWRIEKEVINGKGQFICGNKYCSIEEDLRTWEVNFAYIEKGEKKNALVKIRLCPGCSKKLNYHTKKREIKRLNKKIHKKPKCNKQSDTQDASSSKELPSSQEVNNDSTLVSTSNSVESPWENHKPVEVKSRDEEMEEYLQDLLL
nr:unnamed protein product [Callosobruchus chinensis]